MPIRLILCLFLGLTSLLPAQAADSIQVYIFLSETCPICHNSTLELRKLHQDFKDSGIRFSGVFPNIGMSTEASIQKFGRKYKLPFELILDEARRLTAQLGATHTPQVYVLRLADGQILYRGSIDNSYAALGKKRQVVTEHYLRKALEQVLAHSPVVPAETKALGCFILQ